MCVTKPKLRYFCNAGRFQTDYVYLMLDGIAILLVGSASEAVNYLRQKGFLASSLPTYVHHSIRLDVKVP